MPEITKTVVTTKPVITYNLKLSEDELYAVKALLGKVNGHGANNEKEGITSKIFYAIDNLVDDNRFTIKIAQEYGNISIYRI